MDETDLANELARPLLEADVMAIREAASKIPAGRPGECDLCGEWSGRLVAGVCAPCRDKHGLP